MLNERTASFFWEMNAVVALFCAAASTMLLLGILFNGVGGHSAICALFIAAFSANTVHAAKICERIERHYGVTLPAWMPWYWV